MTADELKVVLIAFLQTERDEFELTGVGMFTREAAAAKLRELIPTQIIVKSVCEGSRGIVAAAPHVRFDGWSEYFARITAEEFGLGRVLARNFRDDNEFDIPIPIGRHIHVNRPAESKQRRGREYETARAREAYDSYLKALAEAGGAGLPLELLIEFHGHRRHDVIEIATTGIDKTLAAKLKSVVSEAQDELMPALRIEPLDKIHYRATQAKTSGSLQSKVTKQSLHIELPRQLRSPAEQREQTWSLLRPMLAFLLESYP